MEQQIGVAAYRHSQQGMCICSAVRQLKVITSFIFIAISGSHLKRPKKNSKRMTGLQ